MRRLQFAFVSAVAVLAVPLMAQTVVTPPPVVEPDAVEVPEDEQPPLEQPDVLPAPELPDTAPPVTTQAEPDVLSDPAPLAEVPVPEQNDDENAETAAPDPAPHESHENHDMTEEPAADPI